MPKAGTVTTTGIDDIKIYKTVLVEDEPITVNYYLDSVDEANKMTCLVDGNIMGVVNYHNTDTSAKNPKAVMALYKGTELKKISISAEGTPIEPDGLGELNCNFNFTLDQGEGIGDYYIKLFVWDSMSNLQPLLLAPSELVPDCIDQ